MTEKLGVLLVDVPDGPKVLSQGGKIILKYPYYSHQRMPWERR